MLPALNKQNDRQQCSARSPEGPALPPLPFHPTLQEPPEKERELVSRGWASSPGHFPGIGETGLRDCHLQGQTEGHDECTDSGCQQVEESFSKGNYPEVPTRTWALTSLLPSKASDLLFPLPPGTGSTEKGSGDSKELVFKALEPAIGQPAHGPSRWPSRVAELRPAPHCLQAEGKSPSPHRSLGQFLTTIVRLPKWVGGKPTQKSYSGK